MLAFSSPSDAYRRVDFDARVAGANPGQLVLLCYERLTAALGSALYADEASNRMGRSQSLTRALSAITALQLGVDPNSSVAPALSQFYGSVRQVLLDSVPTFNSAAIASIRQDIIDIQRAYQVGQASEARG